MNMNLRKENVTNMPEVISTELGFCGEAGTIYVDDVLVGFFKEVLYTKEASSGAKESVLELVMFEILEKYRRKGIGKSFIEKLFSVYPSASMIIGIATRESTPFYESLDASFSCTCDVCNLKDTCVKTCVDFSDQVFSILRK